MGGEAPFTGVFSLRVTFALPRFVGWFALCLRAGPIVPGRIRADSEWMTAAMGLTSLKRRQA
jgi:hypothetical protein